MNSHLKHVKINKTKISYIYTIISIYFILICLLFNIRITIIKNITNITKNTNLYNIK